MTLDNALNTALHTRDTKAVLLFNEVYVPIAGRGDLTDVDVQAITLLLSWTEVETTGQIPFHDGVLHFHHADSHTLVLIKSLPSVGSPSSTERAAPSAVSTSVDTLRGKTALSTLANTEC